VVIEERELIGDDALECIVDLDLEMPLGIHPDLTARSLSRIARGGDRGSHRVGLAPAEQDRAGDLCGQVGRTVGNGAGPLATLFKGR
jgi:hypothetical protein